MEVSMGEAKRTKTFRQHMGLLPGATVALKFFTPLEFAELLVKAVRDGYDDSALESVAAGQTILRLAASGSPIHCLLCRAPPEDLGLMGLATSAAKSSAAVVVCRSCLAAAASPDELRSGINAALGVEGLETSTWAS
jgi:hypothetical protein